MTGERCVCTFTRSSDGHSPLLKKEICYILSIPLPLVHPHFPPLSLVVCYIARLPIRAHIFWSCLFPFPIPFSFPSPVHLGFCPDSPFAASCYPQAACRRARRQARFSVRCIVHCAVLLGFGRPVDPFLSSILIDVYYHALLLTLQEQNQDRKSVV